MLLSILCCIWPPCQAPVSPIPTYPLSLLSCITWVQAIHLSSSNVHAYTWWIACPARLVLGDDLFSTPKASQSSWSFSNSDLGHLQHSSDSNCLQVLETLQSTSYSKSLPAVPNTTTHSFHSNLLPDTPSKGCSKTFASSKGSSEMLCNDLLEANNGVAKSDGGDVGGTWLQLTCCALPK